VSAGFKLAAASKDMPMPLAMFFDNSKRFKRLATPRPGDAKINRMRFRRIHLVRLDPSLAIGFQDARKQTTQLEISVQ